MRRFHTLFKIPFTLLISGVKNEVVLKKLKTEKKTLLHTIKARILGHTKRHDSIIIKKKPS